jgi:hypothetical protein
MSANRIDPWLLTVVRHRGVAIQGSYGPNTTDRPDYEKKCTCDVYLHSLIPASSTMHEMKRSLDPRTHYARLEGK